MMIDSMMSESREIPAEGNQDPHELEKQEEAKLKAKFPSAVLGRAGGPGGHTAFLQKRLAKGQKFFDSGDYQMAKQRPGGMGAPGGGALKAAVGAPGRQLPTGDTIPTPETVPLRKTSIIQPKFSTPSQTS